MEQGERLLDDEVAERWPRCWPPGMSGQDPAARDRPLVFNPQGFLVAILEDTDAKWDLHIR